MIGSTTRVDTRTSSTQANTGRDQASTEMHGSSTRVDMHCHSTASQVSKLGVQRALGLSECATPPEEVYELAKRRGMDFVTITDHDTIDGVLSIAERPDVFVSEELTAHFRGQPQAVHVLCYGITPEDHEWLQANSHDVELCAMYLCDQDIACALAHPYYAVGAPLTARHRRRLAELFEVWETRNGARARELNRPAAMYVATLDGIGIGGSDDHAGIDIGRTWTEAPAASTPREFLEHMRAGRVRARGKQGSAAKWAHAAIALAARSLGHDRQASATAAAPDPRRVMTMAQRLLREGDAREGATAADLSPTDAHCLLRAWLTAVGLDHLDERGLIAYMQGEDFSHSDLYRRACRLHEHKLARAVERAVKAIAGETAGGAGASTAALDDELTTPMSEHTTTAGVIDECEVSAAATGLFESCIAAIPYAPATAFLAHEQAKLARTGLSSEGEPPRIAILADGIGSTHGVSRTIEEIRQRGVPGYEIEVVATDPEVDRRLSAVAELDVPFYPGLRIGVPSLSAAAQTLSEGAFDAIHVCSPGPVGVAGVLLAHALGLPLIGSYHTELTAYARLRSKSRRIAEAMGMAVATFYHACDLVLSPSRASDEALASIGMSQEKILRWDRGVDTSRFDPKLRDASLAASWARDTSIDDSRDGPSRARVWNPIIGDFAGGTNGDFADDTKGDFTGDPARAINVLYAGRLTREKGVDLLADAFMAARERDSRLHLVLAGDGPERERLRDRVGGSATFLGWLHGAELAKVYASADLFFFPSATDTFGQVILEAQASGLPVLALAAGGPLELIENQVTGLLRDADREQLASALLELAGSPLLRKHLASAALGAVRERTWESALERLASGYRHALRAETHHSLDNDLRVA
jgi:glycosyltransferase involved in cell wall biosynthesis/predicted metal-dependent phosphoesterase TrpH